MIQLDEEYPVLKTLDIDWSQLQHLERLRFRLNSYEAYIDVDSNEHIYPLMILENMEEQGLLPKLETDVWDALKEIRQLCDKHDCCYWRIVNLP